MNILECCKVLFSALQKLDNTDTTGLKDLKEYREERIEEALQSIEKDIIRTYIILNSTTTIQLKSPSSTISKIDRINKIELDKIKDISLDNTIKVSDNDIIANKKVITETVKTLRELMVYLWCNDLYWQELTEICSRIVYSHTIIQLYISDEITTNYIIDRSISFLFKYIIPMIDNNYSLALKYESIIKRLPEYECRYDLSLSGITKEEYNNLPMDTHLTTLWFSRIFVFEDLIAIYKFLIESPMEMPYLFLYSNMKEIRGRDMLIKNNQTQTVLPLPPTGTKKLINNAIKAHRKYKNKFNKSTFKEDLALLLGVAVLGVGVAIGATLLISNTKNKH
ncbi:hypothetical protein NEOKW01_0705 [Nematocida sp. AWRm80]|nr:hypothetical protein NEOKW01_0705 [Nematocida sp. AWRm80]